MRHGNSDEQFSLENARGALRREESRVPRAPAARRVRRGAFPAGVEMHAHVSVEHRQILTDEALSLVAKLHRTFEQRRAQLLALRAVRQEECDAAKLPDFLPETAGIRNSE